MRSILKVNHKRSYFAWRLLPEFSIKATTTKTRPFYVSTRSFDCLKTINLDQKSFKNLINVNYSLEAFRKCLSG